MYSREVELLQIIFIEKKRKKRRKELMQIVVIAGVGVSG
jgi:hypothetical protein